MTCSPALLEKYQDLEHISRERTSSFFTTQNLVQQNHLAHSFINLPTQCTLLTCLSPSHLRLQLQGDSADVRLGTEHWKVWTFFSEINSELFLDSIFIRKTRRFLTCAIQMGSFYVGRVDLLSLKKRENIQLEVRIFGFYSEYQLPQCKRKLNVIYVFLLK